MTGANRIANAQADLAAARDALKVAEAALGIGVVRDAMSRTYFAAFHAARALLLLEGYEPKTHGGLSSLFGEHLVRSGKIDGKYAMLLTRLQAYRQASDYAFAFTATVEDVRAEIVQAVALLKLAENAASAAET